MPTLSLSPRRGLALVALFAALIPVAAGSVAASAAPLLPQLAPGNRAGVVVRYGDGGYQARCVAFAEDEIAGDELLMLSGLEPVLSLDGSVCAIGGQGCPADDCFCQCPFPDCEYWGYYHLRNGAWEYAQVGAPFYGVRDGQVDGWSWGQGDFSQTVPPPLISFEQICADVEPAATPTPTLGYTPLPHYTRTPTPAPSPVPPAEIPEPATLLLLAPGLAALGAWVFGRRRT